MKKTKVAIEMTKSISGKDIPNKLQDIHGSNGKTAKEIGWKIFVNEDYVDEIELRIKEVVNYCLPHVEQMWASIVIANLLNCEFRDAEAKAKEYLK